MLYLDGHNDIVKKKPTRHRSLCVIKFYCFSSSHVHAPYINNRMRISHKNDAKVTDIEKWCFRTVGFAVSRTLSCPFDNYRLIQQSYLIPQPS